MAQLNFPVKDQFWPKWLSSQNWLPSPLPLKSNTNSEVIFSSQVNANFQIKLDSQVNQKSQVNTDSQVNC